MGVIDGYAVHEQRATSDTNASGPKTPAYVSGSVGVMPINTLRAARATPTLSARPPVTCAG
jgi:hypothetical protein